MKKRIFFQLLFCFTVFSLCIYFYLEKQNYLTHLRIEIPKTYSCLQEMKEEMAKCEYEMDQWESPARLMQLASSPQFTHLSHPYADHILVLAEGVFSPNDSVCSSEKNRCLPVAIGAHP